MIAYTISAAQASGLFDRIVVSTDSEIIQKIAIYYGADAPFLRPQEFANSTSPDIEWIKHALENIEEKYDIFAILRPTSPFRSADTIRRAYQEFINNQKIDSLRAVELCKQHPGKMWIIEGETMKPLLNQDHLEVAWHAGQYQALPKVYVQNSSLEMAWTKVVDKYNTREGKILGPFLTEGYECFAVDYKSDWEWLEKMIRTGDVALPKVNKQPFKHQ